MNDHMIPGMPRPTIGGMIFNLLMLASPFIGLWLGGPIGLLIGMSVACIGLIWFFFIRGRRGLHCEICKRSVLNMGTGMPPYIHASGVLLHTAAMRQGLEGPGHECQRCGRIYCTNCAMIDMECVCGASSFRTVRLRYRS